MSSFRLAELLNECNWLYLNAPYLFLGEMFYCSVRRGLEWCLFGLCYTLIHVGTLKQTVLFDVEYICIYI